MKGYIRVNHQSHIMVLILDGCSEHACTHEEKRVFLKKKNTRFVIALDLIKCLQEIKYQRLGTSYAHV